MQAEGRGSKKPSCHVMKASENKPADQRQEIYTMINIPETTEKAIQSVDESELYNATRSAIITEYPSCLQKV